MEVTRKKEEWTEAWEAEAEATRKGGGEAEGAGAAGLASCASVSSPGLSRELAVGFSDKYENETTQPSGLGSQEGQPSCRPSELPAPCGRDPQASQCAHAQWQWPPRRPGAHAPWASKGAGRQERPGQSDKGHRKRLPLRLAQASAMKGATKLNEPVLTEH
ncbi:unnamed protein product [Rangifer tarandus platyrhynchus]|uniref:Uncharacterized protein n=2 Tax=Rangifer tarandus platyrhynchus TaxID=3082113 RepID=A0ABN8ZMX5_RANTA|nr:unnamed protein product [Rangifer tarandus platyrhynchus]CAI9710016.1 unnamed protein product [Rangifer tarandus platyrhynchus]